MIPTGSAVASDWPELFAGDDTLPCAPDRILDKASVLMVRGPSHRGRGLGTCSVGAVPQAAKRRGMQPPAL